MLYLGRLKRHWHQYVMSIFTVVLKRSTYNNVLIFFSDIKVGTDILGGPDLFEIPTNTMARTVCEFSDFKICMLSCPYTEYGTELVACQTSYMCSSIQVTRYSMTS